MLAALKSFGQSIRLPRLAPAIIGSTLFGLSGTLPARAEEPVVQSIQEDKLTTLALPLAAAWDETTPPLATPDGLFLDEVLQTGESKALVEGIRARQKVVTR